jgi:hypothetical protein
MHHPLSGKNAVVIVHTVINDGENERLAGFVVNRILPTGFTPVKVISSR